MPNVFLRLFLKKNHENTYEKSTFIIKYKTFIITTSEIAHLRWLEKIKNPNVNGKTTKIPFK